MNENDFLQHILKHHQNLVHFPNKQIAETFLDEIFRFMFVPQKSQVQTKEKFKADFENLKAKFLTILAVSFDGEDDCRVHGERFFDRLPDIYEELLLDGETILAFDPAAKSMEEVLVAYPGFYATVVYRISHQLYKQGIQVLPRLFSEYAHSKTGIDIHPAAQIGSSFFIDHGTGVVIGETAIIGNHVKIYQGVTLGALSVKKEDAETKRHPTIEDHVIIYSGASILGGKTVIGHHSVVGGNVWITQSIAPYSLVYHKNEILVKDKNPTRAINFVI